MLVFEFGLAEVVVRRVHAAFSAVVNVNPLPSPAREYRDRQRDRQRGCNPRPDERYVPQDGRQHAPQQRVRHADGPQRRGNQNSVADVDRQLHPQVPGHLGERFVDDIHRYAEPKVLTQPLQSSADHIEIEQQEEHKNKHDARLRDGGKDRILPL